VRAFRFNPLNVLGIVLLCLSATACETFNTKTDYDTAADFSNYHTFSWVSKSPLVSKPPEVSPLAEGRIMRAVSNDLTAKGFRFVDDPAKADFVVAFTIGARQQVRVTSNPYAARYGAGPYMWGRPYYQDIDVREFTQGRLAIDIFDVKRQQPVWHGHATKSISSSDQKNAEALINQAVAAILKSFPPGSSK
jgi:Domain of unknown function (DUF4136)